jgi:hypothetical protein
MVPLNLKEAELQDMRRMLAQDLRDLREYMTTDLHIPPKTMVRQPQVTTNNQDMLSSPTITMWLVPI